MMLSTHATRPVSPASPEPRAQASQPRFAGNYWFDTEFLDGSPKIELISIGMVAENGESFYGVSNEFNEKKARKDPWIAENVLTHLKDVPRMSRSEIREGIERLVGNDPNPVFWAYNGSTDNVALYQLFGTLMAMRQALGSAKFQDIQALTSLLGRPELPPQEAGNHDALADAQWNKQVWKHLMGMLKQLNPELATNMITNRKVSR